MKNKTELEQQREAEYRKIVQWGIEHGYLKPRSAIYFPEPDDQKADAKDDD